MFGKKQKEEAETSRKLKHNEKFIGEFGDGFFFTKDADGLVRYMSNESYEEHQKSLEFVEPEPEPPVPQGKFFDRSRPQH